ncbi:MAG: hypothetical protein MRT15_03920 [archaeon YNP-LCB-003-016]|nr:hypothetical protein [Candidatus Culexarchaeum yellowstonense]MCR6691515.1 hypothetical protein [Candidatus Culexarchaeum yellowstonense]
MKLQSKVKEWVETAFQTQLELPSKLRLPRHVRRKLGFQGSKHLITSIKQ